MISCILKMVTTYYLIFSQIHSLHPDLQGLRGVPSNKFIAKLGLFRLASDLRESSLGNHGNLSDQTNLVECRLTVRLT